MPSTVNVDPVTHPDDAARAARARLSLEGLALGDAFGERFFAREAAEWLAERTLPPGLWRCTDDTEMALGLYDCLRRHGRVDQDALARIFAARYQHDPWKGYGATIRGVLRAIHEGRDWRAAAAAAYGAEGSMGNGSAMRVGVLGAWFADDPVRLVEEARRSAEVTHAHPDGLAGAIATALAVACMWRGWTTSAGFFSAVLERTPAGPTHDAIALAADLPAAYDVRTAVAALGNGSRMVCSDTVPLCLWIVARHQGDLAAGLWTAVDAGGDRDTTCAIIGAIAGCWGGRANLPADWLARREDLRFDVDLLPVVDSEPRPG